MSSSFLFVHFKCRLCDAVFHKDTGQGAFDPSNPAMAAVEVMKIIHNLPGAQTMPFTAHFCDNGNVGAADFLGLKPRPDIG